MALYEYKCVECEDRFDLMRPMSDADEPAACPECGSTESRRVISNFASITPGASALSTNPVMDARMARGGGGETLRSSLRQRNFVITHAPDSGAQALMVVRMVPKTVVPDVRRAVSTTVRTAASPSAAHIAR